MEPHGCEINARGLMEPVGGAITILKNDGVRQWEG